MSKAAWFHCGAGTAGDMTLASLIDAGADSLQVIEILGGLALDDYALMFERTQRAGVGATRAIVGVHHHDDHEHDHHRSWRDIKQLLIDSELSLVQRNERIKGLTITHVIQNCTGRCANRRGEGGFGSVLLRFVNPITQAPGVLNSVAESQRRQSATHIRN